MSHNSRCYRKIINKKSSSNNKRIDVLFKQQALSVLGSKEKYHKPDECQSAESTQSEIPIEDGSQSTCEMEERSQSESGVKESSQNNIEMEVEVSQSDSESSSDMEEKGAVAVPDARKFTSAKYEQRFSWLYYSVTRLGYCCKVCELFCPTLLHNNKENPFVVGIPSLGQHPTRKLEGHSNSKTHKVALEKKNFALTNELQKKKTPIALLQGKNDDEVRKNRQYLVTLIKTIYFVIRKHWAIDSVKDVMQHMISACDDSVLVEQGQGGAIPKYTSSTIVSELIVCINNVLERKTLEQLRKADAFTLMADESSDESHREQFAIIVRFISDDNTFKEVFLGLVEVSRATAENLMKAIQGLLLAKGVDIKKAAFVGFDGCNVMSGENKGLQRRFRHVVPHQLYLNCRNHKLALCLKHLIKDYPVVDKVDGLLLGLWKLFHYSPRKYATLKEVQASYNQRQLRMLRASTTRWLSHGTACLRLVECFTQVADAIDSCLTEKYEADLQGVREQLLDKGTMACVLLLCDILSPVIRFSDYLQGTNVVFSEVMGKCKDLTDELESIVTRFQAGVPNDGLYINKLADIYCEIDERMELARRRRNTQTWTYDQVINNLAVPITNGLIGEINDAFHCTPVLDAFQVFNMTLVPEDMAAMASYGEPQIGNLAKHYGQPKVDVYEGHRTVAEPKFQEADIHSQWLLFKPQMNLLKRRNTSTDVTLNTLFDDSIIQAAFPAIAHLYHLYRLIPVSTACVERLFSLMNLLCTPHRNRLGQNSLDNLIRICNYDGHLNIDDLNAVINDFDNESREMKLH